MAKLDLESLPEPGGRYKLGLKIGGGVGGEVYEAVESQTGKKVAVKVIERKKETEAEIQQEHEVLKRMSGNENFPEFYGIYSKRGKDDTWRVWLVMEVRKKKNPLQYKVLERLMESLVLPFQLCEGGEATALVRKLEQENKKMSELHIAYFVRETIKAVIRLQDAGLTHRDVRGSNVLLTRDGRVKLSDYGTSKEVEGDGKMKTFVGSPGWMAPEVIKGGYDRKADVWAIGITAIELGEGRGPFEGIHPARALFQIVNNPPPTLRTPSDWSQLYNDFVSECLVKDPEHRPFPQELLLHPFFEPLDKEESLVDGLVTLLERYKSVNLYKEPEVQVREGFLKVEGRATPEMMLQEDLAAMSEVSEANVLFQLQERLKRNEFQTYIGDVLLILNSNTFSNVYGIEHHQRYSFKAKSQNAPHIYSVADSAYRDVFHHGKPQHILFAGETAAGKTANMKHALEHILFLGKGLSISEKVTKALEVIHAMGNAATPHNPDSSRHVLQIQLTFSDTRKVSGALFRLSLLEKGRITTKNQATFHLFYYFHEGMKSEGRLEEFHLAKGNYKFLKSESNKCKPAGKYRSFETNLSELGFDQQEIHSIKKTLAAILLLGEVEFGEDDDGNGVLVTPEIVENVADLLGVDKKKLPWAFLNYCLIQNGEAVMRRNSRREAEDARDALSTGLYSRLSDWVVNGINDNLSVSRLVYGDGHVVSLLDLCGFECYKRNGMAQLFANTMNEQMQFHYNEKAFVWEKQTAEEEGIPFPDLEYSDNKLLLESILSKTDGLLRKIDEATKSDNFSDLLKNLKEKQAPVFAETSREFSIKHYTGKLSYDASDVVEKNRDFLSPELIDTMRLSTERLTKELFSSLLSKSGNLSKERRVSETSSERGPNKAPVGRYSQSRQMRTAATTFRGACLDLFKNLSDRDFGFHFVRCIRTNLSGEAGAFDGEVVRQQVRALAVVSTILAAQRGYSYSVSHEEFIRRYKFLAFDFDENVEETKDNCRLLLLRLKLEGWTMGKTKVFLKYFNTEYLSRLYETQIKKIVKVQSMIRAFMTRRRLYAKIRRYQTDADKNLGEDVLDGAREAHAAKIIQKRFREYASAKCGLTESQKEFIRPWYKRWRTKSIFQVLLLYRAERLQAVVNFCLQVHLYNQSCVTDIQKTREPIDLESVDVSGSAVECLPPLKPTIPKLLFTWESLSLRGDVSDCKPFPDFNMEQLQAEISANLGVKKSGEGKSSRNHEDKQVQTSLPKKEKSASQGDENRQISSTDLKTEEKPTEPVLEVAKAGDKTPFAREGVKQQNGPQEPPPTAGFAPTVIPKPRKLLLAKPVGNPRVTRERNFQKSLNEMEEKFKNKNYNENGDEPPFNFRSLLRKTDRSPDSRKVLSDDQLFQKELSVLAQPKGPPCGEKPRRPSFQLTAFQLAPGIMVYGKVSDL